MFEDKIKAALKDAGLDEGLFDKIKVKEESEIERAVGKLKKTSEMLGLLKESDLLDTFNAETDRRITKALETFKTNLEEQKKPEKTEKKAVDKVEKTDTSLDAFAKLIEDKLSPILGTVESLAKKDKMSTIAKTLKDAGLPETFIKYVNPDAEDLGAEVTTLKEDYNTQLQSSIDQKIKEGAFVPKNGSVGDSVSVDKVREFAKSRTNAGKFGDTAQPFVGAKLNIDKE